MKSADKPKEAPNDIPITWQCKACGCKAGNFSHYFTCAACGERKS